MKATKKIVGAACALVAAVALSAGSTFAWFASNGTVKAEGMKVKASVPTALLIAGNHEAVYSQATVSATAISASDTVFSSGGLTLNETTAHVLSPTTITNTNGTLTFGTATSENVGDANASATTTNIKESSDAGAVDATVTVDGVKESSATALSSYIACYPMQLYRQVESDETQAVNAKVTLTCATDAADNQLKFLHVGILTNDGTATNWVDSFPDDATTVTGHKVEHTLENVVAAMPANTAVKVLVVVYFEGKDVDCYSNNAMSVGDLGISIDYSVVTA